MTVKKKKEEETALTTVGDQSIAPIPEFLKKSAQGRGRENVDQADLVLPRIKLLQPLSPEVQEEDSQIEAGHLYNTLTQNDYGDSLIFIPVMHFKSRIYWRKRDDDSPDRMLCSSPNGLNPNSEAFGKTCPECPMQRWNNQAEKAEDKAPKCTSYYNFAILVEGETSPIALSFERTKVKIAKKLLSLISIGNLDMFAKKYKIGVTKEKNKKGTWFNYDITPVGFVTADEFKIAEVAYNSLKGLALSVEQDTPAEAEEGAETAEHKFNA
jgi:hypothetical protein